MKKFVARGLIENSGPHTFSRSGGIPSTWVSSPDTCGTFPDSWYTRLLRLHVSWVLDLPSFVVETDS